jgi:hypothetical protein
LTHFNALVKYGEEYGTCNIPTNQGYVCTLEGLGELGGDYEYDKKLGMWLSHQRQLKKGNRGTLHHERESLLQSLVDQGKLLWETTGGRHKFSVIASWHQHYLALLQYGEEHDGDCNVPTLLNYSCTLIGGGAKGANYEYEGKLGMWLSHQRQLKKGKRGTSLTPERENLLQNLVDQGNTD